jgi:hypothetical protein
VEEEKDKVRRDEKRETKLEWGEVGAWFELLMSK